MSFTSTHPCFSPTAVRHGASLIATPKCTASVQNCGFNLQPSSWLPSEAVGTWKKYVFNEFG
jgi:hypothetical protein